MVQCMLLSARTVLNDSRSAKLSTFWQQLPKILQNWIAVAGKPAMKKRSRVCWRKLPLSWWEGGCSHGTSYKNSHLRHMNALLHFKVSCPQDHPSIPLSSKLVRFGREGGVVSDLHRQKKLSISYRPSDASRREVIQVSVLHRGWLFCWSYLLPSRNKAF